MVRFGPEQKHFLYMELAKLLGAGFPFVNAVETLAGQKLPAAQRIFVDSVRKSIEEGRSISEAISEVDLPITDLEKTLIIAGEKGGRLPDVFRHIGDYFQRVNATRKSLVAQLFYPVALFHVAVILSILPRLIKDGNTLSTWLPSLVALGIFYVVAVGGFFVYRHFRERASRDAQADSFLNGIPLFGDVRRVMSLERFCKVFQIYLLAGLRPSEAIEAAGEASQSGSVYESALGMKRQLELGLKLGPLFTQDPVMPTDFSSSIATAEEAGTLDDETGRWSRYFAVQSDEALDNLKKWLPRIIYLFVVVYVAYLILSLWMDYIDTGLQLLE